MIIISPYPRQLRNGKRNPKEYPYWKGLVKLLEEKDKVIQIGTKGEHQFVNEVLKDYPLEKIMNIVKQCKYWVSVDNFLQHMIHHIRKPGVVLWGRSDPNIFGYPENINILKSRDYLRENQFGLWEEIEYDPSIFLLPEEVIKLILF